MDLLFFPHFFFISSVLSPNLFFRIAILVSNAHDLHANINTNRFEFQGILILESGQNSKLAFLLLLGKNRKKTPSADRPILTVDLMVEW